MTVHILTAYFEFGDKGYKNETLGVFSSFELAESGEVEYIDLLNEFKRDANPISKEELKKHLGVYELLPIERWGEWEYWRKMKSMKLWYTSIEEVELNYLKKP